MSTIESEVARIEMEVMPDQVKNAIKPLFYILTGKPDSLVKLYTRDVTVTLDCVKELNNKIIEKLDNYEVNGLTFTMTVTHEGNTSIEFGSWGEFNAHDWNTPDVIKSMVIKWDFLIKFPNYGAPQRHSVSLRITQGTSTKEMLQFMLSNDLEDIDQLNFNESPMYCRVDFINTLLGTEILELVDRWNKSRMIPKDHVSLFRKISKHKDKIADGVRYSIPIFIVLLLFSSVEFITRNYPLTDLSSGNVKAYLYWLIISATLFISSQKIGLWTAKKLFQSLDTFGRYSVFQFTKGDKNKQVELANKNKTNKLSIIFASSFTLLLNVTAGLISCYLYDII